MTTQDISPVPDIFSRRNGAAVRMRLQWLEFVLYWAGQVRREDLIRRWGISFPQASSDLAAYQALAPGNLDYDYQQRCYKAAAEMRLFFPENADLEATLSEDSKSAGVVPILPIESVVVPKSNYPLQIMRMIIESFQKKIPLEVCYHDRQNRGGAIALGQQLTVCPHHLITTTSRTYLRGWVKEVQCFVNLVPARIKQAKLTTGSSWVPEELDEAWHKIEDIVLIPSKRLYGPKQNVAAELEYGLTNGQRVVRCRACMVYYVLAAMNLEVAVRNENGECGDPVEKNTGLAVENWQPLQRYCKERV
jgi:hypothetical protein